MFYYLYELFNYSTRKKHFVSYIHIVIETLCFCQYISETFCFLFVFLIETTSFYLYNILSEVKQVFGHNLAKLRKEKNLSQYELAEKMGFSRGQISNYEQGTRQPDFDTLQKFADFFEVSTDYLLGRTQSNLPELTPKEEINIKKDLEKIINNLENPTDGYAHFDGLTIDDVDEEDRELLIAALETSMRIAKQIAKKKYTPKKYRKED